MDINTNHQALKGLKILDISTMLAAPWVSTYLADFGADVIKVEHPEYGDHSRKYGKKKNDIPIFWKTLNRNKKGITLNLSQPEGQELLKKMVAKVDVIIENFRPGTLEKWNIGWDVLSEINPSLIMLRVTGFGQDGPYAKKGGFGTVAEAMSGFTSINGPKGGPPTLPGAALADGVCSVFGALAIMIALHERSNDPNRKGQFIDISLYEPLMRILEPQITAYDQLGIIPQPIGNSSLQTAPRNAYQTKDGTWVALSGSSQSIAANVFKAIGREELIEDERFCTNEKRLENVEELDKILAQWIGERELDLVIETFTDAGAVIGPMYNMSQLFEDPHYNYRQSLVKVQDKDFGELTVANVFAKFSKTPGKVKTTGPDKGQHNDEIYKGFLSLSEAELKELQDKKII